MKQMFTRFFILIIAGACYMPQANAQFPTIYATVNSGTWNTSALSPATTIWETFPGNATNTPGATGTGSPYTGPTDPGLAVNGPSGTHFVYIRAGHTVTMNGGNRSCHGMFIEEGGKLWANESTARRLQLVTGGTGFAYPQSDAITNHGVMGGATDGLYFEAGTNCQNVTINGTGSIIVQRLRVPGGLASVSGGVVNITLDNSITFTQATNYAASLIYNPQPTDNYSLTIAAGKTITISNPAGYFNNNSIGSGGGFGTYTYNINGTLDLTASTQTTNQLTAFSPTGGIVNMNLGATGLIKTGAAFNSSPVAPGVANLNIAGGALVDATLATVMNFNGNSFTMGSGTAVLRRTIPASGVKITYPVGTANGSITPVSVANTTGPDEVLNVSIKNTFTNPAPANTMLKEWNLSETTPGGNSDTLRFEWTTADQSNGFTAGSSVFILRWNGSSWDATSTSLSGTGTALDPYVAKGSSAFSQLGLFVLSNSSTNPVSLVNVKAYQKSAGVQVEFGNATEENIASYNIEKSADGSNFTSAVSLQPKTNNGGLNSYTYFDAVPFSGNNYYRIKVTERNGTIKYSSILNVRLSVRGTGVNVYPNPVKGSNVNVQFDAMEKAVYSVTMYNSMGQKVFTKNITHNGGTATYSLEMPASVKKGIYNMSISNSTDGINRKIVVE